MKALSKKRGRPRKVNVIREPNGRITRAKEPPAKLALEVRARMHKLSIDKAHDQQAGQWLGRLHMAYQAWHRTGRGKDEPQPPMSISTGQYHALLSYQGLHNDHLKAVGAPGAYYDAHGLRAGTDEEAAARWAEGVKRRHMAARKAIQSEQNHSHGDLWAALDLCIIQEQQHPHMIGEVRTLGNVLRKLFSGVDR
jgi:hypothetical protein